jgi:hypothetical protein
VFTFGSVYVWVVLRSEVAQNVTLCSLMGITSGVTLILLGQHYFDFVDYQLGIYGSA